RDESCGQCVPCRVGTVRQEEALHRLVQGRTIGSREDEIALLGEIAQVMRDASICGLGQTAAGAVQSAISTLGLFVGGAAWAQCSSMLFARWSLSLLYANRCVSPEGSGS